MEQTENYLQEHQDVLDSNKTTNLNAETYEVVTENETVDTENIPEENSEVIDDTSIVLEKIGIDSEIAPEQKPDERAILERLTEIEEELKRSNKLFDSKMLYDSTKEDVINRLHKELQTYKDDMFKKILKPVFMDMILFADSMRTLISNYEETPDETALPERYQKLRKEFLKIGTHIEDVIYNYGIEPYSAKSGDEFNPKTQQAKRDIDAASENEHRKIADSLIPGYTWDEQLLRKEGVSVYLYRETK
jgi:molecular chaperone GrpE (heat shock protein)